MTSLACGGMPQLLPCAQVETAVDLATREWTIAGFAILVWLLSCGLFLWLLRTQAHRRDEEVKDLVTARNAGEEGRRADLQAQIKSRAEDAERVERGLAEAAASTREQARATEGLGARIAALESRAEAIDRRTEAVLAILDRRGHERGT